MPQREVTRTYIDLDTGEERTLMHEETVPTNRRGAVSIDEKFAIFFPRVAAHAGITGREFSVLCLLIDTINIETNASHYSTSAIAAELGIRDQYVSACIASLEQRNVIRRLRRGVVLVNPTLFWRGSIKERRAYLTEQAIASSTNPEGTPA